MSKPNYVSEEQLAKWNDVIKTDNNIPEYFKTEPVLQEVIQAGFWLVEELEKLNCDKVLIAQFRYTHGKMCFGHDPWEQAEILINDYLNGTFIVEN